jgi:transposase
LAYRECIGRLGGWEGYEIEHSWEEHRGEQRWCVIRLRPIAGMRRCCSGCGGWSTVIHDAEERWVRDLPIFEVPVVLVLPRIRVACARCGPKLEQLGWLEPYARVTRRLAASVARLCKVMSILHVARFYGLAWTTVKLIDWRWLERELGPVDLAEVSVIAMDEFAIQKGHRYATVVVEPYRKRVLWVGRGRGREEVQPFFELLGPRGCAQLQAVAMDMNAAYELEVRAHCPQAQIVYDLFHVIAKYGREVIDRVRVDEANRLRQDRQARHLVKGSRWLLLRNRENLTRTEDQVRLEELLAANRALFTCYVLRDDLKTLWDYRHAGLCAEVLGAVVPPGGPKPHQAAEGLRPPAQDLPARHPRALPLAAWNESDRGHEQPRIKVIKRMAYGFRDDQYFFLKIRAAFPGIR